MSKLKFEIDDFSSYNYVTLSAAGYNIVKITREDAVKLAQKKFDSWLESQQVVYANLSFPPDMNPVWGVSQDADTHSARLVDIQELKPQVCEHKTKQFSPYDPLNSVACVDCGKKLKATWTAE